MNKFGDKVFLAGMVTDCESVRFPIDPLALLFSPIVAMTDMVEDELGGHYGAAGMFKLGCNRARPEMK